MTSEILALVAERSGLVFAPIRREETEAGIARAMKDAGATDLTGYLATVRGDSVAFDRLIDELAVGETHFMRDPDQMDLIRREVFPALERRREQGAAPRVWSAGCATGEEAYSLAILLEEAGLDAFVLGTDLCNAALQKARAGSYSDWSMRGVSDQFLSNYFRHVQEGRVLIDRIRNKVHFEHMNLIDPGDYASAGAFGMDLILCRNVLMYLGGEAAGRVARRLYDCLAEGGVLLTAGADPLLAEFAPFEVEVTRAGLVYRRPACPSAAAVPGTIAQATQPPPTPDAPHAEPDKGKEAFLRVMDQATAKGSLAAERIAKAALRRHPLDAPLHYLRATLLLDLDRDEEAEHESQRALYLDPSLAIAHFLLGTILRKRGAHPEALRAFRNVRDLCAGRPSDEEVRAGAGVLTGALHSAASAEMERLEVTVG